MAGAVEKAALRDLKRLPEELAESALAASVLALAREMDGDNSATAKSMCARTLLETLNRLRELTPPEQERDGIDQLADQRARRLAARSANPADLPLS